MAVEQDFFKKARRFKYDITQGTADKQWYYRIYNELGWTGPFANKASAMVHLLGRCKGGKKF